MFSLSRNAVVLLVAGLVLMLSAGAGATAALVITGKQIKDGTVTTKDVKNKTLKYKDFAPKTKSKLRGATGPAGPRGATGATGATGAAGAAGLPGLSGFEVVSSSVPLAGLVTGTASAACPAGKKAISASGGLANPVLTILTQVTRVSETAFEASALSAVPIVGGTLSLDVVCATIPS
jgi:hypothetical protein